MLPGMALVGGLLWHLERRQTRRLSAADRVLRESAPMNARLAPTGLANRVGTLVAVQPETRTRPPSIGPILRYSTRSNVGMDRASRPELTVQLYCAQLEPGQELVALQDNGDALLGKLVALDSYRRQTTWMTAAVLGPDRTRNGGAGGAGGRRLSGISTARPGPAIRRGQRKLAANDGYGARRFGGHLRIPGERPVTGYRARIEFEYVVAGTAYRGDHLSFCQPPSLEKQAAETRLTRIRPERGSRSVDPTDPTRGVLEPGRAEGANRCWQRRGERCCCRSGLLGLLALIGVAAGWGVPQANDGFRVWATCRITAVNPENHTEIECFVFIQRLG